MIVIWDMLFAETVCLLRFTVRMGPVLYVCVCVCEGWVCAWVNGVCLSFCYLLGIPSEGHQVAAQEHKKGTKLIDHETRTRKICLSRAPANTHKHKHIDTYAHAHTHTQSDLQTADIPTVTAHKHTYAFTLTVSKFWPTYLSIYYMWYLRKSYAI